DHRVDRVLQLEDLAAGVDGGLTGEVAVRDGRGHLGDVPNLAGEVRGHRVDRVGEVLPCTTDTCDLGLPTKLSLRADLARHARDLRRERVELVDHRVDRVLQLEDLAAYFDGDLLREVADRGRG